MLFETFDGNTLKGLTPEHLEVSVISQRDLTGEIRNVRLKAERGCLTGMLEV